MEIVKTPLEALKRQAHQQYVDTLGVSGSVRPEVPGVVNVRETLDRDRPVVFAFRGKPYILEPIPYDAGIELHDIQMTRLKAGAGEVDNAAYEDALDRAVALMGRLARRRGWRGRAPFRWLLPNPFRKASEREIGEVLDFFWKCRTGTRFRHWLEKITARATSTGSTNSTSSAGPTAANRVRGATSSGG